jgi:hypothetical protein
VQSLLSKFRSNVTLAEVEAKLMVGATASLSIIQDVDVYKTLLQESVLLYESQIKACKSSNPRLMCTAKRLAEFEALQAENEEVEVIANAVYSVVANAANAGSDGLDTVASGGRHPTNTTSATMVVLWVAVAISICFERS